MSVARRFTIGRMMVVVVLMAVDFAFVRAAWQYRGSFDWTGIVVTTLPTMNVLLLAAPEVRRPGLARAFWAGFEVAGWTGVAGVAGLFPVNQYLIGWPIHQIGWRLPAMDEAYRLTILITSAIAIYTTPLLLLAWAAGRISAHVRAASLRLPD